MRSRILVVDNYDSFVFNLVQYLQQLGEEVTVRRNDDVPVSAAREYDGILLSPGPGTPASAGVCCDLVDALGSERPIFGVCLGHQAIAEVYGGTVSRAPELLHGKTSQVSHDGRGVFADIPSPFTATRYHSLAVEPESVPEELEVTAHAVRSNRRGGDPSSSPRADAGAEPGVIMGLRHRTHPVEGVQFHPESVLTQHGHRMLANWLAACGHPIARKRAVGLAPLVRP